MPSTLCSVTVPARAVSAMARQPTSSIRRMTGGRIVQTHPEREPRVGVCPDSGRGLGVGNGGTARMSTRRPAELEEGIGEVAASYGAGRLNDSLSSDQRPNTRQVIDDPKP